MIGTSEPNLEPDRKAVDMTEYDCAACAFAIHFVRKLPWYRSLIHKTPTAVKMSFLITTLCLSPGRLVRLHRTLRFADLRLRNRQALQDHPYHHQPSA